LGGPIFTDSRGFGEEHEEHNEEHEGKSRIQAHTNSTIQIGLLSTARTTVPIESRGKYHGVESHVKDRQEDGRICGGERIATQVESQRERPSTTRITTRERPNP
jgi:hypothetical protein